MMSITFSVTLLIILCFTKFTSPHNIKLVTVLFRHGDRTPDGATLYPLDPHFNESYFPVGIGQLTSKGKQHMFELGQLLRQRYDTFLGNVYYPDLLEATSTDVDRTKASLQLVLAGLFPPKGGYMEWNSLLNWQPIPYHYTSTEHDTWMVMSLKGSCPRYAKLFQDYLRSPPVMDFTKRHYKVLEYLRDNADLVSEFDKIWGFYTLLLSQVEWGLEIPEWTKSIFPDVLYQIALEVVHMHVATMEMKQLSGGPMLKKIIGNMVAKTENKLIPEGKKLILYSAHDINIVYLSSVLEQPINHLVPYGSYYIIELLQEKGTAYVQIFANDYVTQNITAVQIPGCQVACPLTDFINLLNKYFVDDNACRNV